jgi:release factor H-coupled RctB family protein
MKTINPPIHQSTNPSAGVVRLFASTKSWVEGEALRQLYATAKFDGMCLAVGFPDLHPGKGSPVGVAFVSKGLIYPHVIGGDIGCGMALFRTDLPRRSAERVGGWADLRFDLEHPWEGDVTEVLDASELESTEFDQALGTLGGGNHFAELQMVDEVLDARAFKVFGLGKQQLVALVHSGSRGLGESVLQGYVDEHQANGSDVESFAASSYLEGHDLAVRWAKANRALVARRFVEALGAEAECLWDGCHNSITPAPCSSRREEALINSGTQDAGAGAEEVSLLTSAATYVHRKGAVATEGEPVIIPGSRGSLSYLVQPLGDGECRAWSLAHGAGRKWARSEARLRMRERFGMHQLTQTPLGGRVICEQRELLYEEAPAAYKNIEDVIQDLVDAGLVSVIATFRPLLTYKTRAVRR